MKKITIKNTKTIYIMQYMPKNTKNINKKIWYTYYAHDDNITTKNILALSQKDDGDSFYHRILELNPFDKGYHLKNVWENVKYDENHDLLKFNIYNKDGCFVKSEVIDIDPNEIEDLF